MHLHKEAVVSVSHIGFGVDDDRYVVFFIERSATKFELGEVVQKLHRSSELIAATTTDLALQGNVVNFWLKPSVIAADALPQIVALLQPACTATAEMLRIDYTRYLCEQHHTCNLTLLMAPGLDVANQDAFLAELPEGLKKIGLPYILPSGKSIPVMVFAAIRMVCRQLGMYAQGINLTAAEPIVCPACNPW